MNSDNLDDIFKLDPDDVIISETGEDFYTMRKRLQSIPYNPNDTTPFLTNTTLNDTTKAASTTEKIRLASVPPEIAAKFPNTTLRMIKEHRLKMQLDRLLSTHRSVTDYLTDFDVSNLTRKVDQMIEKYKKTVPRDTRRESYSWGEDDMKWEIKTRYMNLITHFVYITRYKLVYPQVLRKKYFDSYPYKFGFMFALLRHLKNMQKWLYWTLTTIGFHVDGSVYFAIKLYEKIQRLDIDIKDLILLITKTQYHRNLLYNPKFYDYEREIYYD